MSETPLKMAKLELGSSMNPANCYVLWNEDTKEAFVFDPGFDDDRLFNFLKQNNLTVNKIFLTHGHYDHIGGVERLRNETGAEVVISKADADYLMDAQKNMSAFVGLKPIEFKPAEIVVSQGDEIEVAPGKYLTVLETPGHTDGSICYVGDGFVVSGDLIFEGSIGRTDFPTGNFAKMCHSLKNLSELGDDTIIFPGHGNITTVGHEKKYNPFLNK